MSSELCCLTAHFDEKLLHKHRVTVWQKPSNPEAAQLVWLWTVHKYVRGSASSHPGSCGNAIIDVCSRMIPVPLPHHMSDHTCRSRPRLEYHLDSALKGWSTHKRLLSKNETESKDHAEGNYHGHDTVDVVYVVHSETWRPPVHSWRTRSPFLHILLIGSLLHDLLLPEVRYHHIMDCAIVLQRV